MEFTDLIPLLACSDIEAEHDFLVDVLGLESGGLERTAGGVVHGEVRAGERRIWLHRTNVDDGLLAPRTLGAAGGGLVVHVDDVDAHYDRARAAGAEIVYAPRDQDYGQREYGVRDPEGHTWWIGTPMAPSAAR
jgi:uncharacterized glyoxalase superfamily protein PhnB